MWTRALEVLLFPPAGLFWMALAGMILLRSRRRVGLGLLMTAWFGLYVLSTPWWVENALGTLDRYPPVDVERVAQAATAIVILGAGHREGAREYGGSKSGNGTSGDDTVSALALERLTYGAWLHRQLEWPILVTGVSAPEMAWALREGFGVEARWLESRSRNTYENAVFSQPLLDTARVERVFLVTHFWHMPRAVSIFRHVGIDVIPAPMGFVEKGAHGLAASLLPRSGMMLASQGILHEWLGRLWYSWRYE